MGNAAYQAKKGVPKVSSKTRKCSECGRQTVWQKVPLDFERKGIKVTISEVEAMVCPNCHEVYFSPEVAEKVHSNAEKLLLAAEASLATAPEIKRYLVTMP
ncbi:MAG: YgiT-type zinc finger protein [Clostridia bacterium]|nr:MAG: YgiT-type zinc finger protein [Clostridia bacterium]